MATIDGKEYKGSTWADIPPETAEHAYRRGYRDGWIMALEAMWDAMRARYSRCDAYDLAAAHGDDALFEWVQRCKGDDAPEEWPPDMTIPKRGKRVGA